MPKQHLPQVKTFKILYSDGECLYSDDLVNDFVIEKYNETGNTPTVHACGDFVMVVWSQLIDVKEREIPSRTFAHINTSGL